MTIICITGTGTDIGKTIATAAIAVRLAARGRHVTVVKPAQTGFPGDGMRRGDGGDLDDIARLSGIGDADLHEFARYPEPMAPLAAARRAGLATLRLDDVAARIRDLDGPGRTVLVEGAGGLLVRLGAGSAADTAGTAAGRRDHGWGITELAKELPGARLVVVTSLGLGSLNAAETTVEVAGGRGLEVAGLIGGSKPAPGDPAVDRIIETNIEDLPHLTGVPFLGAIPAGSGSLDRGAFAAAAVGWLTPAGAALIAQEAGTS